MLVSSNRFRCFASFFLVRTGIFQSVMHRFAKIEADLSLLKWMLGFNLAGTVALVLMQLRH